MTNTITSLKSVLTAGGHTASARTRATPALVVGLPTRRKPRRLVNSNVWEWCEDAHIREVENLPSDGRPYRGSSSESALRGGCFHNWAIHCTVSKRYESDRAFHDGCIGFRLVLSCFTASRLRGSF